MENGACFVALFDRDSAAVSNQDFLDQGKTYPISPRLGGEERYEHTLKILGANPAARIPNPNMRIARPGLEVNGSDYLDEFHFRIRIDRLNGVPQEVRECSP